MSNKKKIWFIRHAQSLTNADNNFRSEYTSASLVPLSEFGIKQSEDLLRHFKMSPDLIIVSPYLRAKQTAKFLTDKYKDAFSEEWGIYEFTYLSQKKCVGTTFNERQIMVDAYWKNADPFYIDGDGAESFADFFKRVCYTIDDLKLRKENFIVLFSHEYFILAVRYLLEKGNIEMTKKEMEEFRGYCVLNKIQNAKIIEINNNLLKSIKTIIF